MQTQRERLVANDLRVREAALLAPPGVPAKQAVWPSSPWLGLGESVVEGTAARARLTRRPLEPLVELVHPSLDRVDAIRCVTDPLPPRPPLEGFQDVF